MTHTSSSSAQLGSARLGVHSTFSGSIGSTLDEVAILVSRRESLSVRRTDRRPGNQGMKAQLNQRISESLKKAKKHRTMSDAPGPFPSGVVEKRQREAAAVN